MAENHVIDEFKSLLSGKCKVFLAVFFCSKSENNSQILIDFQRICGIIYKMRIVLNFCNGVRYEEGIYNRSKKGSD